MVRLNKVIELLEVGKPDFAPFLPAGSIPGATWIASSGYDGVVFEIEHGPFDTRDLQVSMQFLLDRQQIAESGTLQPSVVPFVRLPINGREQNQWLVTQVLPRHLRGRLPDDQHPRGRDRDAAVLPLHPAQGCAGPEAGRPPRPRPRRLPALLGRRPARVLRQGRRLAARPERRDPAAAAVPDDRVGREPAPDHRRRGRQARRDPDQRERPVGLAGAPGRLHLRGRRRRAARGQDPPRPRRAVRYPQASVGNIEERIKDGFQFLMAAHGRDASALQKGRQIAGR